MNFLIAIFQGIVQGITEWLPISSTGHMLLLNQLLPMKGVSAGFFDLFKVVIQFGSILAVIVLFFHKLNPWARTKSPLQKRETWSLWGKVLIASIPAAIVGLLFNDAIDNALSTPAVIASMLILFGILFIVVESLHLKTRTDSFAQVTFRMALLMGVFQMVALIPGVSRSGVTIIGALLIGCARPMAAEFSFFMAIPVMLGASALKMLVFVKNDGVPKLGDILLLLVGMVVAFAVSLLVIGALMRFVKKHNFKPFGVYRIALGVLVLVLLAAGFFPG
ncbi:MAG: undecaprenyl-diphosphate phosphatase [Oscillospiraceae bacterium]|nr:undecaprenyl-diphosphate phosphatase [Oscillospiraceae bacterium]